MGKSSAGLLLYRPRHAAIEVLLVHPGGPYWKDKDESAWSIPKGEFLPPEDPLVAARREFFEETGVAVEGEFRALEPVRQAGGKIVHARAVEGDLDPAKIVSARLSWNIGNAPNGTHTDPASIRCGNGASWRRPCGRIGEPSNQTCNPVRRDSWLNGNDE